MCSSDLKETEAVALSLVNGIADCITDSDDRRLLAGGERECRQQENGKKEGTPGRIHR